MKTYRTEATAIGGRHGAVASADGALKARLSKPRALGGKGGPGTNPEQLFAGAYAADFLEALKVAAADAGETLADDANVTVSVTLESALEVPILSVTVAVDLPGQDHDTAVALACRARASCPYSRVLGGHLEVQVSVP
jgi:osmotically inducible protein OsmC